VASPIEQLLIWPLYCCFSSVAGTHDFFFYRDLEEAKEHEDEESPIVGYIANYTTPSLSLRGYQWGDDIPDAKWWSLNLVKSLLCLDWPCLIG
jgi:hypothetical protein